MRGVGVARGQLLDESVELRTKHLWVHLRQARRSTWTTQPLHTQQLRSRESGVRDRPMQRPLPACTCEVVLAAAGKACGIPSKVRFCERIGGEATCELEA